MVKRNTGKDNSFPQMSNTSVSATPYLFHPETEGPLPAGLPVAVQVAVVEDQVDVALQVLGAHPLQDVLLALRRGVPYLGTDTQF